MFAARMRRCLFVCVAICSIAAVTLPARGADIEREKEARALLAEGEKLNEATRLYEALSTFKRVRQHYPDTEAGAFSEFWRAEVLARLGDTTEAIEIDQRIVKENPGTILACWAQYGMAQMMGPTPAGIAAMRKVREMLPNRSDLTPFDLSRVVLGDWCGKYLVGHQDALDAAEFLGLRRDDTRDKAETLAIMAAHVAKSDGIQKAKPILDRLISECPGEREEVEWAKIEAAIACIDGKPGEVEYETLSVGWLTPYSVLTLSDDDQAAKACLALARYYKRNGKLSDAAAALKHAADRHANTGHGAQVLYEYGCALGRQGRNEEAIAALKQMIARKPLSTHATAAETMIESLQSAPGLETASLEALIKEADANFDPKWQALASAPTDGSLHDPAMVARQAVALSRQGLLQSACALLDRFVSSGGASDADGIRARAHVCLMRLRALPDSGKETDEAKYLFSLAVLDTRRDASEGAREARVQMVELLGDFAQTLDPAKVSSDTRARYLYWAGCLYMRVGQHKAALKWFKNALSVPGTSRDVQAQAMLTLGMTYRDIGYNDSARHTMRALARDYRDTPWGRQAGERLTEWANADAKKPPH
jgi:tetratricopeptide (TPR) repeat protein